MATIAQPLFPLPQRRLTVTVTAIDDDRALAQRAAAGDGDAFAALYERYEGRVYNLCLRIVASEDDAADATQEAFVSVLRRLPSLEGRELAFGSYVFTSARNACYDLLARRRRAQPSGEIADSATPVGSATGGGGIGFDPGDPEDDPERNVLQQARTEEIAAANASLPERQREALALKELEGLSYDEIAEIMGMNRNSVAQLISRARINLRDALRGTALASIASSAPDCERALPLVAAREDTRLATADDAWLSAHLAGCETCKLAVEAMAEAGVSYRAWAPVAAGPLLLKETLARAAALTGSDWTGAIARAERRRGRGGPGGRLARLVPHPRIAAALAGAAAIVLLLAVLVGSAGDAGPPPALEQAAETAPAETAAAKQPAPAGAKRRSGKRRSAKRRAAEPASPAGDVSGERAAAQDGGGAPVPATEASEPVAERPARARRERRARVESGAPSADGGGLTGGVETPAPVAEPEPAPAPAPAPEPPPATTPEPPAEPPATPCGTRRQNPCPPSPPPICVDPATGRELPCVR